MVLVLIVSIWISIRLVGVYEREWLIREIVWAIRLLIEQRIADTGFWVGEGRLVGSIRVAEGPS